MKERNYTIDVIPYIPIKCWYVDSEVHYTGHIYYNSPHECDDNCGTCDGGACDYCRKISSTDIICNISIIGFKNILAYAFPYDDIDWKNCEINELPKIPSIKMVYDNFPEIYDAIIKHNKCDDLFNKKEIEEKERKEKEELNNRLYNLRLRSVYIGSPKSYEGFEGSLIQDSDFTVNCKLKDNADRGSLFIMESDNYAKLRSCIPEKLLSSLDNNMIDYFNYKACNGHISFEYIFPKAWSNDMKISYAYKKLEE